MIWQLVYFILWCILTSLTLLMEEIGRTSWYEESITIYRVSYIPGGDLRISEPSTVCRHGFHHVAVCTASTHLESRLPGDLLVDILYVWGLTKSQVLMPWYLRVDLRKSECALQSGKLHVEIDLTLEMWSRSCLKQYQFPVKAKQDLQTPLPPKDVARCHPGRRTEVGCGWGDLEATWDLHSLT